MLNILEHIHSYLPSAGGESDVFEATTCIGDQLTVERAVNAIMSRQNGYSKEERLANINIGIADWHADMNFLQVYVWKISLISCFPRFAFEVYTCSIFLQQCPQKDTQIYFIQFGTGLVNY